jgi:hypothetical protein
MVHACGFVELEDRRGFIEHDWNWLLDWLVVRQGLARRIYGAADAGLSISNATYPSRLPVGNNGVVSG